MRTILLREHESFPVALTDAEVAELLRVPPGVVEVRREALGQYMLRPKSRVGTVVLPSLRLLIRPKVGLRNLFFLLGYASGVRWGDEAFPYDTERDLLRAVAWLFDREVARASRFGLVRGYHEQEQTLPFLRGRIDLDGQIKARPGRDWPLECRFSEFSEDIPLNQVLKAAHAHLLSLPGLDDQVISSLRFRHRRSLGEVANVSYSPAAVPPLSFTRLNQQWESAARLAQMILGQETLADRSGSVMGTAFTIDMNKLFERFVEVVLAEQCRGRNLEMQRQAKRPMTEVTSGSTVQMKPDLVLRRETTDLAVGDAKYKKLKRLGDWDQPDLYQLLAYCVSMRLSRGVLIYASLRPLTSHRVVGTNLALELVGIDLSKPPVEILGQARDAVGKLIANAEAEWTQQITPLAAAAAAA